MKFKHNLIGIKFAMLNFMHSILCINSQFHKGVKYGDDFRFFLFSGIRHSMADPTYSDYVVE